jgi:Ribosome-associated protein Y (PSrp-1)
MTTPAAPLILRGVRVELSESDKNLIARKAARLARHEPEILRIRIDVERTGHPHRFDFVAKGHLELPGPDLSASVTTDEPLKSVDLLIAKLDRMLRKRATAASVRRNTHTIRELAAV